MIGRHYLVYHKDDISKKRQYTIANCMDVLAYAEYMKVIQSFDDSISAGAIS